MDDFVGVMGDFVGVMDDVVGAMDETTFDVVFPYEMDCCCSCVLF